MFQRGRNFWGDASCIASRSINSCRMRPGHGGSSRASGSSIRVLRRVHLRSVPTWFLSLHGSSHQRCRCRSQAGGRPLHYTEWNTSSSPRDPRHDEPYAAAFAAKTALEASGLAEGYSFWTFSDIFEECSFPSLPFHGGLGLLTLHGIAKPVYRAFQLLHELGDERLVVDGLHHTVDAWIVRQRGGVTILLTNHALPRCPIRREHVRLALRNSTRPLSASVRRIDESHANAGRAWRQLGAPEYLSSRMIERLESASRIREEPCAWSYANRTAYLDVDLPAPAVASVALMFQSV